MSRTRAGSAEAPGLAGWGREPGRLALAAVLGLLAAACAAPSITPETRTIFERSSTAVYRQRQPLPWKVGQWVLFRTSESSSEWVFRLFGYPSAPLGYRRIGITGREGGAYWIDYHEIAGHGDLHMALLIDGFDPRHMDRLHLVRIRQLGPDGRIEEIAPEGDGFQDLPPQVAAFMAGLRFVGREGRRRTISVPAGTFESANAVPISFSTTLGLSSGYLLLTNAVPVVYYAKRVTRRTAAIWFHDVETVELVDFGLTGARSSFHP